MDSKDHLQSISLMVNLFSMLALNQRVMLAALHGLAHPDTKPFIISSIESTDKHLDELKELMDTLNNKLGT